MALRELFLPLQDGDILVPGERVYYHRRRHAAVLLQPTIELISAVAIYVWLMIDVPVLQESLPVLAVVLVAITMLGRLMLRVDWRTPRTVASVVIAALVIVATRADIPLLGVLVALGLFARLAIRAVRWYWFRRVFITDRRVIEVDGLFGSRVASMPLTRVTDAVLHRSAMAEILGYGEFRVESAGQNQALARINFLDDPDRFHLLMVQMAAHEQPVLPEDPEFVKPSVIFDQYAL